MVSRIQSVLVELHIRLFLFGLRQRTLAFGSSVKGTLQGRFIRILPTLLALALEPEVDDISHVWVFLSLWFLVPVRGSMVPVVGCSNVCKCAYRKASGYYFVPKKSRASLPNKLTARRMRKIARFFCEMPLKQQFASRWVTEV